MRSDVDTAALEVHFSALKQMVRSPAHCLHALTAPWGESTLAQRLGTVVHTATFEPHRLALFTGKVRRGKDFDAFKADQLDDAVIVNAKEMAHGMSIANALQRHPDASRILFGGGVIHEREIKWSRNGRACSSRPDARIPGRMIADLKTCRTAHPERFVREAIWNGHHAQVRFYDEADAIETGRPFGANRSDLDLYVVAVESAAPYVVQVYQLDASAIVAADRAIGLWWDTFSACERENVWPGYSQCVQPLMCDDPENFLPGAALDAAENDNAADDADDWSAA